MAYDSHCLLWTLPLPPNTYELGNVLITHFTSYGNDAFRVCYSRYKCTVDTPGVNGVVAVIGGCQSYACNYGGAWSEDWPGYTVNPVSWGGHIVYGTYQLAGFDYVAQSNMHTCSIKILEYQQTITADTLTNTTTLISVAHGLLTDDFIVNTNRARASRRIVKINANQVTMEAITSQAAGDSVRLYKFVDRTEYIRINSLKLSRKAQGQDEAGFQLTIQAAEYSVYPGQYVRIYFDSILYFTGIIDSMDKALSENGATHSYVDVHVTNLNQIPARRTMMINYAAATTCETIVNAMAALLKDEGISEGTTEQGAVLSESWQDDTISVSDILDECASKSGYQWFIDKNFALQFYQDPGSITTAAHALVDSNGFTDYRDMTVTETIDNYVNKGYLIGGSDARGNPIMMLQQDTTEIQAQQDITAGTGIFGTVYRDSAVVEHAFITADTSTAPTIIYYGGHPFQTGDFFWNLTRGAYGLITDGTGDPDHAHCDNLNLDGTGIASQAAGDTIVAYLFPNVILRNLLKRQKKINRTIEFNTFRIDFNPQEKLHVTKAALGLASAYYCIESVDMTAIEATDPVNLLKRVYQSRVKAVLRDASNFSTQKIPDSLDYFRGL